LRLRLGAPKPFPMIREVTADCDQGHVIATGCICHDHLALHFHDIFRKLKEGRKDERERARRKYSMKTVKAQQRSVGDRQWVGSMMREAGGKEGSVATHKLFSKKPQLATAAILPSLRESVVRSQITRHKTRGSSSVISETAAARRQGQEGIVGLGESLDDLSETRKIPTLASSVVIL
jgi:hypothetical protein